jgi:hypothetical protein
MVAPIICGTKFDDTDASKQSKTSSGESPELVFMMLETTRNSKNLQANCQKRVPGNPLNWGL